MVPLLDPTPADEARNAVTVADSAPGGDEFWSPWATVAWSLAIAAVFVAVQVGVMMVWMLARASTPDLGPDAAASASGDLFAVATLATAVVCSLLVWAAVAIKRGATPRRALVLARPPTPVLATWIGVAVCCILISDALTVALGKPLVPEFMTELFRATATPALLWPAIVVAAPFFEELLMRGFLLEGLRRGALGDVGAVTTTAAAWAAVHLQYDAYELGTIFVFGLVLGAARLRGGSLWVPIAMHVVVNLTAAVETALFIAR